MAAIMGAPSLAVFCTNSMETRLVSSTTPAPAQAPQPAQQQAQAQSTQSKETFNKAYGACLEGKGYSVK